MSSEAKQCVMNLRVNLDNELSFKQHISAMYKTANFHLYNTSKVQDSLSPVRLIKAFVTSKPGYCNVLLSVLPKISIAYRRLRVPNLNKRGIVLDLVLQTLYNAYMGLLFSILQK